MVVGDKNLGVASYVLVGGLGYSPPENFLYFSSPRCEHFLKQIFRYTALHCALIDRI